MKRLTSLLCLTLLLLPVAGCGREHKRGVFYMDTYMTLTCYGKNAEAALDACETEIARLDALFSAERRTGDVGRINESGGAATPVDPDTAAIIDRALIMSERTGGAFDITVRPLIEAWGFTEATQRVPDQETLAALLPLVDYRKVLCDGESVQLGTGMALDLGGIAKGYCSDRLAALALEYGVTSALFSLGGNVQAVGTKPDGTPWRIGIQDPENPDAMLGVVEVSDAAVITSGSYQRYFEQDGVRYHHILDPKTGMPADSGLLSVTVIAESGADADALSTALFVMGLDRAAALWRDSGGFEAVFALSDGTLAMTENAIFTPADDRYCRILSK